jgi:hypothetical protein
MRKGPAGGPPGAATLATSPTPTATRGRWPGTPISRRRTAPAVLDLLADGVPRSRAALVAAPAGRHAKEDVARTLMRLAVTGRVDETGGRYALAAATDPAPGEG